MISTTPHRSLMLLHRLVDTALAPLLAPMDLEHATEGYVTVSRSDLDGLISTYADPQAVLAGFGPRAAASGVLVAEPALSSTILSRIWRSSRNEGAPLTQVEGEILRQFLARLVGAWAGSWRDEGVALVPEFSMGGSLSMLQPQLASGTWHVARTVVRERGADEPIGVLLFCYPAELMPQVQREAGSILWRSRVERGLTSRDEQQLAARLAGPLRDVAITAPVVVRQHMTLGMINSLERGDIIAFETDHTGAISLELLDRRVTGRLARSGDQLALALGDAATGSMQARTDEPALAASAAGGGFAEHHAAPAAAPEPAPALGFEESWSGDSSAHDAPPEPDPFAYDAELAAS